MYRNSGGDYVAFCILVLFKADWRDEWQKTGDEQRNLFLERTSDELPFGKDCILTNTISSSACDGTVWQTS